MQSRIGNVKNAFLVVGGLMLSWSFAGAHQSRSDSVDHVGAGAKVTIETDYNIAPGRLTANEISEFVLDSGVKVQMRIRALSHEAPDGQWVPGIVNYDRELAAGTVFTVLGRYSGFEDHPCHTKPLGLKQEIGTLCVQRVRAVTKGGSEFQLTFYHAYESQTDRFSVQPLTIADIDKHASKVLLIELGKPVRVR